VFAASSGAHAKINPAAKLGAAFAEPDVGALAAKVGFVQHSSHSLLEIAAQCTNGWSDEAATRRKPIWGMPPLGRKRHTT